MIIDLSFFRIKKVRFFQFVVSIFFCNLVYADTCSQALSLGSVSISVEDVMKHQEALHSDFYNEFSYRKYYLDDILGSQAFVKSPFIVAPYEDVNRVNYTYLINSKGEFKAVPYAQWVLDEVNTDYIEIYRSMGIEEFNLWRSEAFDELGGTDHSHSERLEHLIFTAYFFNKSASQLTVKQDVVTTGLASEALIRIRIKTSAVRGFAANGDLRSAKLNEDSAEFVFTRAQLKQLYVDEHLTFEEIK